MFFTLSALPLGLIEQRSIGAGLYATQHSFRRYGQSFTSQIFGNSR